MKNYQYKYNYASKLKKLNKKNNNKGKHTFKIIINLILFMVVMAFLGISAIWGGYLFFNKKLPQITSLKDYKPPIVTSVYGDDNRKIAEFYKERRILIPMDKMPKMLINAFVAAEDSRFFKHKGIDYISIIRAFFKNLESGSAKQGGSTITQQVAKSFFLTPEKKITRKIKEAILAYRIDRYLSKDEVLFLYLNQIYLGHGAYGVEAASENYFGKNVEELNLAECAILGGLPQAPSNYSPFRNPEKAKERQIYVLNRMVSEKYITKEELNDALNTKLDIKPKQKLFVENIPPFYAEHIRRYIEKEYGADTLYKEGLSVYTTANIEMNKDAWIELERGLRALDKRQGYRGSIQYLDPEEIEPFLKAFRSNMVSDFLRTGRILKGVVVKVDSRNGIVTVQMGGGNKGTIRLDEMKWARKPNPEVGFYETKTAKPQDALKIGDVIYVRAIEKNQDLDEWHLLLEQTPNAQGALLCIEVQTGCVKAMIGGRDFKETQLNRVIQSKRQPGSVFKPIIYAAALDKGYTPVSIIVDSPLVYDDGSNNLWKPHNYENKFNGPTTMRDALAKSLNLVTIKILKDIGVEYVIDYAKKLGVTSVLGKNLSLALGSAEVSLFELVSAYSVFANQGYLIEPVFITKILDRDGRVIEQTAPKKEQVIEKNTAYIITSLLESVVKYGTGQKVSALNRPVAGKTGTTNKLNDAWFIGYTPSYITGVWIGLDDGGPLGKGETGGKAASPIFLGFMKKILDDKPIQDFEVPEGVVFSQIDAETGLLPIPESKKVIFECFKEGTVPTQSSKKADSVSDEEKFWKTDM